MRRTGTRSGRETPPVSGRERTWFGVLAGLLGAISMMPLGVIAALQKGLEPTGALRLMPALFFSPRSSVALAVGSLVFVVTSAAFGVVYAKLASRNVHVFTDLVVGPAYGVLLYFGCTRLLIPWAAPALAVFRGNAAYFAAHLVYGLVVALAVQLRRGARGGFVRPSLRPTLY